MNEIIAPLKSVDFDPFADLAPTLLPLTDPQLEMCAAVQMGVEASCAYNQCFVLRLRGQLSVESMQRALAQVVERHEALRLRLRLSDDGETQEILHSIDVALPCIDLADMPELERHKAIARALHHETHTPFDLSAAPLWRAQILRDGADSHRLIFTAHHLVCDGWSSAVILGDLAAAYSADRFGMPAKLVPAASYRDFIEASESALLLADAQAAEAYWVEQYASSVPSSELPLDHPRPPQKTYAAAREILRIDEPLYQAIRKMSARQGCTLFVTLLAAFEALVARLSCCEDLIIGVPMASQALREEDAHLVAHGVNTIPLRCRILPDNSFSEHLHAARKTFLDAQAHQRLTFGSLLRRLKLPRDPSRTPLVNVTFNIDRVGAPFVFGELALEGIEAPKAYHNFELSINAIDNGRDLVLECDYNTDLYKATTVARWLGHYRELLSAVAADPTLRLSALPLLNAEERLALTNGFGGQRRYPRGPALHELFERQVESTPHATALTAFGADGERLELSYADLNARANGVAHELRALGVVPNQLVGLRTDRNAELVIGILGILKSGAAYLPLDPVYPKERVAFMLEDSRVGVVLTQSSLKGDLAGVTVICLDESVDGQAMADVNPPTSSGADDLAYVIYTSGSTGKPKGARITHHNVCRLFVATDAWYGFNERDVWTLFHSYAFDFSVWEMWGALLYGGRLVVVPLDASRSIDDFHELLVRERVTVLNQTPTAFRLLIDAMAEKPEVKLALRYVVFGGEALELQSLRPWFARHGDTSPRLINMYGITETTVHVTYRPITLADLDAGTGSVIGAPLPDLKIYILDPHGEPAPIGVPGEMYVSGAGVGLGYLNRPELSTERFLHDPFDADPNARMYRSGDMARRLDNGDIEYLGRMDQQVKIRGFRIELGEIEAVISQHPQVRQVAVIVREDSPGDLRLVSYVVPRGPMPSADTLRDHLIAVLPQYMLPTHFVFLPALPLTQNGKLDRRSLPPPGDGPIDRVPTSEVPLNQTEATIAGIWEELLVIQGVRGTDNFFDLGGHSILAMQAAAKMQQQLGVRIDMRRLIFDNLTQLATLAGKTIASGDGAKAIKKKGMLSRMLGKLRARERVQ